jgi:hypothetical protein
MPVATRRVAAASSPHRGRACGSIRRDDKPPPRDNERVIARPELPENAETLFRAVAAAADALEVSEMICTA